MYFPLQADIGSSLDLTKAFSKISSLIWFVIPNIIQEIDPRPRFQNKISSKLSKLYEEIPAALELKLVTCSCFILSVADTIACYAMHVIYFSIDRQCHFLVWILLFFTGICQKAFDAPKSFFRRRCRSWRGKS